MAPRHFYSVRYHDYASIPIGETARPDVHVVVDRFMEYDKARTLIVSEAAKFMNELRYSHVDRIEKTFITVMYYEGKIDRYRRFYLENENEYDGPDFDDVREEEEDEDEGW